MEWNTILSTIITFAVFMTLVGYGVKFFWGGKRITIKELDDDGEASK